MRIVDHWITTVILAILAGNTDILVTTWREKQFLFARTPLSNWMALVGAAISTILAFDKRYRAIVIWAAVTFAVGLNGNGWHEARIFPTWPILALFPALAIIPFRRIPVARTIVALAVAITVMAEGAWAYFVVDAAQGWGNRWYFCDAAWKGMKTISLVGARPDVMTHYIACGIDGPGFIHRPSGSGLNWPVPTEIPYSPDGPYADRIIFLLPHEPKIRPGWSVETFRFGRSIEGYSVTTM